MDAHACPICAVSFKLDDMCLTDVELGSCHAECLAGSPMVDLDTGAPLPEGAPPPEPYRYDSFLLASSAPLSEAIIDVLDERRRQVTVEGYDAAHDDEHKNGEIARAAAVYAAGGGLFRVNGLQVPQQVWPYRWEYKPKDERTNMVRAAAMLIAEIERLDRATGVPA